MTDTFGKTQSGPFMRFSGIECVLCTQSVLLTFYIWQGWNGSPVPQRERVIFMPAALHQNGRKPQGCQGHHRGNDKNSGCCSLMVMLVITVFLFGVLLCQVKLMYRAMVKAMERSSVYK